jgi:hypothetical protein
MASGPEMIKAAVGTSVNLRNQFPSVNAFNTGVIPASTANANPLFNLPPQFKFNKITTPGAYGESKPQTKIISTENVDPEMEAKKKTQLEQLAETEAKLNKDTAIKKDKDAIKINETNKKILDKKVPKNDDTIDEGTGEVFTSADDDPSLVTSGGTGDDNTTTSNFDDSDIQSRIRQETADIQKIFSDYTKNLENVNQATILGKTFEEHQKDYFEALNKKPEEVTFADVKDAAFDMLGYDKDTLDQQLTDDQQGSIWLNMMRAGLAIAAGESPNTLTNVAKGFSVGLEGYGRDMKNLKDDYREDVDKYQNTMYRLLKDEKAERIAMNALDVQRKAAQFQVVQQTRGDERKQLLDALNTEVAMRKIKLNTMSTLAQFNLEKFKLDKSSDEFQKTMEMSKAKIAAMLPDEIQAAIASDLVQLKDPDKSATADNLELTPKGIQSQFDLIKALKEGSKKYPSESITKMGIYGSTGGFGIKPAPDITLTNTDKEMLGLAIQDLNKSTSNYQKALDPTAPNPSAALDALITKFKPLNRESKGRIILDAKDLPGMIKTAIENNDPDILKTLKGNEGLIANLTELMSQ